MSIMALLETYKELGVAVLFLALFLVLFRLVLKDRQTLIKEAADSKKAEVTRVVTMSSIVEGNTQHMKQQNELLIELRKSVERDTAKQAELLTYLKLRDNMKGNSDT